jgi:hypothetical protein
VLLLQQCLPCSPLGRFPRQPRACLGGAAAAAQVRMRRSQIIKELGQIMVERNRVNLQALMKPIPDIMTRINK